VGFILSLLINKSAVSQFKDSDYSRDLVVGELSGRVDPVDIWNMIQTRYYPVIGNNTNLEKVIDSSQEQIYKVNYPEGNFVDHPGRVIFKFYDSENSLIAATIIEEIDFAITESYGAAEEVDKSTSSFRVHFRYQNPNHVKLIAYNNQNYILKSAAVRQALTYAIDRSYILEKILGRAAYLADGPLSRESKFHAPVDEYKFNPRKALQLLHQDNWIDSDDDGVLDKNGQPFRISLIYEKGVLLEEQLATRIKIDWNKIGIDVIRKPLVKSEIKEKMKERNYDVILTSHIFDETIESFEGFFGSTSDENFLGYKNRKVDHFISLYKIQKEPTSKKLMFQAIQRQVSEDQAAAFLFYLWVDRYFVNQKKFTNFMSKGQLLPFTDWKLRK
jgi:ABC-type transport system substrate-binding protein